MANVVYEFVKFGQKCFFRQFFHSVEKVDYLTLRHGFISVKYTLTHQSQVYDYYCYLLQSNHDYYCYYYR